MSALAIPIVSAAAVVVLVARWSALLVLAWLAHAALSGRDPRWRVLLWRLAVAGVGVVAVLSAAPPVVTWPVAPESAAWAPAAEAPALMPRLTAEVAVIGPRQAPDAVWPAPPGRTAPAEPATALRDAIAPALLGVWAVVAALLAARLVLAGRRLSGIVARSREVSEEVGRACRETAAALGGVPAVRARRSAEVMSPCLAGLLRPVVLLPDRPLDGDDLRAALAHELAHARGRDLAWNLAAHAIGVVLWFHPLAWRIRSAHATACDAVCDAVATDHLGDVPAYARSLARLALAALAPPPAPGLAMARSCDVRRRVDALRRKVFRSPLPRRLALPALLGGAALVALIGGLGVTVTEAGAPADAEPAKAKTVPPAATGRLEIQAVAAATGMPVEGAAVVWNLRVNDGRYTRSTATTGADGRAALGWPEGATVNTLQITARKPGFVPYAIHWSDRTHPLRPPAVKTLRLVPGVAIGGVVTDDAGRPVAGAKVTVNAPPTESDQSNYSTEIATATTDAQGRWRFGDAPVDPRGVNVQVQAPGFLRGGGRPSRDLDAVTVLKRGFPVKGRVLDARGKPVAGARVSVGDNWSSEPKPVTTDARGEFLLANCPPGASVATVRADGFAPDLKEIHPEDKPALEFVLGPGHTLRGRVVDPKGKPVAGAWLTANGWRRHQSLDFSGKADKDGRFEWKDAPADAVVYAFAKPGFMSRHDVALSAAGGEQAVTLDPALVISGRVTDAATGKPVPTFRVVRGLVFPNGPRVSWMGPEASEFSDGRYTVRHDERQDGFAVRIEAAGYRPAESPVFRPGEARQTFDAALTRAAASDSLTGTVLRPDGTPAAGAEVALATPQHPLLFEMEQVAFSRGNGMSFAKTGPDGRFAFDAPDAPYLLAAMSDDGYAEATQEAFAKSPTLALRAWGKIKGRAFIGRKPAANEAIIFLRRPPMRRQPEAVHAFTDLSTRTDAQGRFAFDRVIPDLGEVARVVVTEFGNGSQQHMGCWQEPIDVEPGETVEVTVGGKGRPVVGRVVVQGAAGAHVDWRQNRPATITRAPVANPFQGLFGPAAHQFDRFAANLDRDGRFRIDDVPPGRYELTVSIDAPAEPRRPGPARELGRVKVPLDVPEGPADRPVDVGDIRGEATAR